MRIALKFFGNKKPAQDADIALQNKLIARERWQTKLLSNLNRFGTFLLLLGYVYIAALPLKDIGKSTYVSENALQPAQVNVYWDWNQVREADELASKIESWSSLPAHTRCGAIRREMQGFGLTAGIQSYSYANASLGGCNTYATIKAPKTDGAESMILAASWKSRDADKVNIRGVAIVLALAKHLSKHSLWSKDIVVLIGDDYIHGTHAFVSALHQVEQSSLAYSPLTHIQSGPLWAALQIDYPYHSFDRIGIYYEGVNGLLPNLDFITSTVHIIKWVSGGVPATLHHLSHTNELSIDHTFNQEWYMYRAKQLLKQVSFGAMGLPSGPEGVYAKYRIDAIALYAIPAEGPYGFYSLGRVVESSLRSINNLLERFHASAFLYLMTSARSFIPLANYVAATVLVGVGLTMKGLHVWFIGSAKVLVRNGELGLWTALIALGWCQICGIALLRLLADRDSKVNPFFIAVTTFLSAAALSEFLSQASLVWLRCINLLLAGMVISVTAVINFSLAVLLSVLLGVLAIPLATSSRFLQVLRISCWVLSNPFLTYLAWDVCGQTLQQAISSWLDLGVTFLPVCMLVVVPLQMQGLAIAISQFV